MLFPEPAGAILPVCRVLGNLVVFTFHSFPYSSFSPSYLLILLSFAASVTTAFFSYSTILSVPGIPTGSQLNPSQPSSGVFLIFTFGFTAILYPHDFRKYARKNDLPAIILHSAVIGWTVFAEPVSGVVKPGLY